MITATCPRCGHQGTFEDSEAGKTWSCRRCGETSTLPSPLRHTSIVGSGTPRPSVEELVNARALVQEFWNDINALQRLGIKLNKVGMGAKAGGVGAGIGTYLATGDPILGVALAVAGWVIDSLTEDYGKLKLDETRVKWSNVVSSMGERQLALFASAMQERYPHLLPAVRQLLNQ